MENNSYALPAQSDAPPTATQMPAKPLASIPSRENNFDAIRLMAALQVALTHLANYLGIESRWIHVLEYFPGVPIFFFISGYLIFQSYASTQKIQPNRFFVNRALRLFPGLLACTAITLASIELSGYHILKRENIQQLLLLFTAHNSILQFYNPSFLREYGSGAVNGSLWTIGVELQFYLLTPLLFALLTKYRNYAGILFALFILTNIGNNHLNGRQTIGAQLIDYSFIPWFYMFAFGALLSTKDELCKRIVEIRAVYLLVPYCVLYYASDALGFGLGNSMNPISFAFLCAIIIKCAYSRPGFSDRILRRNDISYGIYIYHMPVVNFLLQTKISDSAYAFCVGTFVTLMIAIASWFLIEKPCIKLKRSPNRALDPLST